jgi:hypothetical protein
VASNVRNILHRQRARRKGAGPNMAVVVARNQVALVPNNPSAAIAKAATNGIFPAPARRATCGVSARVNCRSHGRKQITAITAGDHRLSLHGFA